MKIKNFIYLLNTGIIVLVTVFIYFLYSQQKENTVKLISSQIRSTLIQTGYVFSKILNNKDEVYMLKPFLDRKVATSEIIKGFLIKNNEMVLVKSGKVNTFFRNENIVRNIYEIGEQTLLKRNVFVKSFSFYSNNRKITYEIYLFTDKHTINSLLEGLKVKFAFIWIFMILIIFISIEALVKRFLIKPMDYLKMFADKKIKEKKDLSIKEFDDIKNVLDKTFKELDTQINYLYDITVTDPLTGLGNRKFLYEYLYKKLKNTPKEFAVVLIDLDNFKDINDFYGHHVGDEVLIKISRILKENIDIKKDVAIRIGGDEFVLIIESFNNKEELNSVLNNILHSLHKNWSLNGEEIITTVSMGVSLYPQNGTSIEELMKNADIALYEAKKKGKNKIVNFNEDLKIKINKMLMLKNKLKKALEHNEFEMFYQPKVDKYGKVAGCEALIRWFSDEGMIAPCEFIPVAERSGFMVTLGEWIAYDVLKTRKEWDTDSVLKEISIAFNVSIAQMKSETFLSHLITSLNNIQCNIKKLEVEITESVFIENKNMAKNIINEFHNLGFKVNLDDFGTGYSSLSFLQEFNVDILKIDKAFVDNVLDKTGCVYVKTIIDMAKNLGLETVAEGVETKEQFEVLKSMGVDYFQGYYFSKPVSKKEFMEYVKSNLS